MPAQENMPAIDRLTITLEKLCFIMRKLRQFNVTGASVFLLPTNFINNTDLLRGANPV
jgi:hypothetical protein